MPVRLHLNRRACVAAAAAALLAAPAAAFEVHPDSYAMLNGETGSFTYRDDAYTPDPGGARFVSLASLSGGLGDLTDGVVATQRWDATPGLYVGWHSIDPVITFDFDLPVTLETVRVHVDDADGHGGVLPPSAWAFGLTGALGPSTPLADPAGPAPFSFDIDAGGLTGTSFQLALTRVGSNFIMLSEVEFFAAEASQAVPVPAAGGLLAAGLGLLGLARRRRAARG